MISYLYYGDCIEYAKSLSDNSIDMVFTDLPYGTTKNKWDIPIDLDAFWLQVKRITKPTTPILLNAQLPFDKVLGASNLDMLRYEWIWEKPSPTGHFNAKKMPMKAHEQILVFYDKLPVYNYQKTTGHERKRSIKNINANSECYGNNTGTAVYNSTSRYPRSIQVFSSDKQRVKSKNTTKKPLALAEYMIRTYSNEGDTVLDLTMGSGTYGVACVNLNRNFIGCDSNIDMYNESRQNILHAKSIM